MGKSLVIVESPAKAKTINKYLGNDFIVKSSIGHIRDLPTGGGKTVDPKERARTAAATRKLSDDEKAKQRSRRAREQLVNRMGIDPEHGWKARYEILPGKEKVVAELKKLAKDADHIYLATDLDREGEAIAWHLMEAIGGDPDLYQRVVFNEITKKAIKAAFEKPGKLDTNRVSAQQARRFLGMPAVVLIAGRNVRAAARCEAAGKVAVEAEPVLLRQQPHPGIRRGIARQPGAGVVGGAVVRDDDFEVRITLRQQRIHLLAEIGAGVVGRQRDGHQRAGVSVPRHVRG